MARMAPMSGIRSEAKLSSSTLKGGSTDTMNRSCTTATQSSSIRTRQALSRVYFEKEIIGTTAVVVVVSESELVVSSSHSGGFSLTRVPLNDYRNAKIAHVQGSDPNLPPLGKGWVDSDSDFPFDALAFEIAPQFEAALKSIRGVALVPA